MFGSSRRHRPPNHTLSSGTADPNAATAAASAFMSASNQRPNRTLSSAAAAAALRARPHTPTNVGAVQTKRTMRRSSSVSSSGSAAAKTGRPTGQLERRPSAGSMTDRSFRSPSPHRSSPAQAKKPQPPVPQIPSNHRKSTSSTTPGAGMQNFRTASQKMGSEHPSWYTQPSGDPTNVRTSDAPMSLGKSPMPRSETASSVTQRPDSRSSSVNFSYPIGFHAHSPPASPTCTSPPQWNSPPPRTPASPPRSSIASISSTGGKSEPPMVYDPNSRRMVPKAQVDAVVDPQGKEKAGRQPRKKRRDGGLQRAGSQLAKGTVARVKGTTIDDNKRDRELPKREQPVIEEPPTVEEAAVLEEPAVKAIITAPQKPQLEQNEEMQPRIAERSEGHGSPSSSRQTAPHQATLLSNRAIGKRPSIVEEEPEETYEGVTPINPQDTPEAMGAISTRRAVVEQPSSPQPKSPIEKADAGAQDTARPQSLDQAESLSEALKEQKMMLIENKPVAELARTDSSARRSASNSPVRQARFATSPSDSLPVRHTPLPRSASPIKSALKRTSPSPREASPSDNSSEPSIDQPESSVPRKKSVRVSFDDRNTMIVGEAAPADLSDDAAPPSPQQQAKRPWYSNIGRGKRREFTLEDDEIMKPRPALPSFGSIRDKKVREAGERPLVRPLEPVFSPAAPSSPDLRPQSSSTLADSETTEEPFVGQSSDHALGALLAQDQSSRNEANISRFREPLPPIVTSVEGGGYMSDSTQSSDSDSEQPDRALDASDAETIPTTQPTHITQPDAANNSPDRSAILEDKRSAVPKQPPIPINIPSRDVPGISIIQPTPLASEHSPQPETSMHQHKCLPGGFPDDDSEGSRSTLPSPRRSDIMETNPTNTIFEPTATVHPAQTNSLPQTTLATTAPLATDDDKSTDSSEGSIYSDAQEDLADVDGDGFMSLDAVVESPVGKTVPSQVQELPGDTGEKTSGVSVISRLPSVPRDANEWEIAKSFWRSLTVEKRLQLEREVMEDAGADGDRDEAAQPVRRNSSRKKKLESRQRDIDAQRQGPASSMPSLPTDPITAPVAQLPSKANNEPMSSVPKQSRMRTSLRGEEPTKEAKSQPSSGMRKTMRSSGGAEHTDQSSARRVSAPPSEKPNSSLPKPNQIRSNKPRPQTMSQAPSASVVSQSAKPTLQRRGSDASDSSFKRNRAASTEGFGFRRTMRRQSATPQSTPEKIKGSGRFSLRSLSPTGSPFRRGSVHSTMSGGPTGKMRHTLRSGSGSSQEGKRSSLHMPSFGWPGKGQSTKNARKSSRFGDSSDEDEGVAAGFRSRFEDSSDEEDDRPSSSRQTKPLARGTLRTSTTAPAGLRRSTPVPEEEEDSPELPDSDEDEMPSPLQSPKSRTAVIAAARAGLQPPNTSALGTSALTRSRSGRGSITPSVSAPALSDNDKRSSFIGILRRNRKADQAGKIQRSDYKESAARRDTRLERNPGQLKDIRGDQVSNPKLQKRGSVKRGDNWPLSEPGERPSTAGNLPSQGNKSATSQPIGLTGRRSVSLGPRPTRDDELDNITEDGLGQKKKKKFGALRRMFRLDE